MWDSIEYLGISATIMVIISFMFNDIKKVRIFNLIGCGLFVIYGARINSLSVWLLNSICGMLQLYKLLKSDGGESND